MLGSNSTTSAIAAATMARTTFTLRSRRSPEPTASQVSAARAATTVATIVATTWFWRLGVSVLQITAQCHEVGEKQRSQCDPAAFRHASMLTRHDDLARKGLPRD